LEAGRRVAARLRRVIPPVGGLERGDGRVGGRSPRVDSHRLELARRGPGVAASLVVGSCHGAEGDAEGETAHARVELK
jgi:hypothetical protein